MSNQSKPVAICPVCRGTMALARVLPRLGPYPELLTFRCEACGEVETQTAGMRGMAEHDQRPPQSPNCGNIS